MSKGTLKTLRRRFPKTDLWVDSMVVENIQYGLQNGMIGVTTSPTVTSDSIAEETELWNKLIHRKSLENPGMNQFELLWEVMYDLAEERSRLLLLLYRDDESIDGRFCIQGNVYDYMNTGKIIEQSGRLHALAKNIVMKIPTTEAGTRAMEEIVYNGQSVMATATSSVSQVMAAAAALYRGLERRKSEGLSNRGIAVACAMQLGLPEMCYTKYALENRLGISAEALKLSAVAVAKKAYRLLLAKYPLVTFVLSNFETESHWREFMGGRLMMTMPIELLKQIDSIDGIEDRISVPVDNRYIEALREKIPFYRLAYDENAMQPGQFDSFEGFCRTVNLFMDIYEKGVLRVRKMLLPDPYLDSVHIKY